MPTINTDWMNTQGFTYTIQPTNFFIQQPQVVIPRPLEGFVINNWNTNPFGHKIIRYNEHFKVGDIVNDNNENLTNGLVTKVGNLFIEVDYEDLGVKKKYIKYAYVHLYHPQTNELWVKQT